MNINSFRLSKLADDCQCVEPPLYEVSDCVQEFKRHLRCLHEADLCGSAELRQTTAQHTICFALKLLNQIVRDNIPPPHRHQSISEIALKTLNILSQRLECQPLIRIQGGIEIILKLISPLMPSRMTEEAASIIGNLAGDYKCLDLVKQNQGIIALMKMIQISSSQSVKVACAIAIALLSVNDPDIQDQIRHQGGTEEFIAMVRSDDICLQDVGHLVLQAMAHCNPRNQREIRNLIKFDSIINSSPTKVQKLKDICGEPQEDLELDDLLTRLKKIGEYPNLHECTCTSPHQERHELRHVSNAYHECFECQRKQLRSSSAPYTSSRLYKGPLTGRTEPIQINTVSSPSYSYRPAKPLALYTVDDVQSLLQDLGLQKWDTAPLKNARINGSDLIRLSKYQLKYDFGLPQNKVTKVQIAQDANRFFERVSSSCCRGRITEMELRIFLALEGICSSDIQRIAKAFKQMSSSASPREAAVISFWDFAVGFEWFQTLLACCGVRCLGQSICACPYKCTC